MSKAGSPTTSQPRWRAPRHYGWVVVAVGAVVSMAALGLSRFAFGMVLPSMQAALGFSYEQVGWVGTGNFVGYLVGASASGALTHRWGPRAVVSSGLALIVVALTGVSIAGSYWPVLVAFAAAGLGSGASNVAMIGMLSRWFLRSVRGWAAGLVVAGIGLGPMLSGPLVPLVNRIVGPTDGWRVSWRIMAVVIALVGLLAAALLRDSPDKIGMAPAGHPVKDAVVPDPIPEAERRMTTARLGLIYSMYGFSYAIYATFIVTSLVRERGIAESAAGWVWATIGFLSLFCGLFGKLSDIVGRKLGLATVFAMHAVAYLIVGLHLPGLLLYVSVFVFGVAAWSVPGIMGATAGDYMPPEQAVTTLGRLTVFFGIGQAAGPAIAGVLAERTGDFGAAYLLAAAAAVIGVIGSLAMPQPGYARQTRSR